MHEVAVGALVRDDRVLLGLRSPNKLAYPNVWDLPGGLMEPGESELDALTRELHEELGVQIATNSVSHLCRLTVGPAEDQARLSAWLVHDWQGTPANVAPEEHDDIQWFGLEELPPLAHPLVRATLLNARRATAVDPRHLSPQDRALAAPLSGGADSGIVGQLPTAAWSRRT